MRDILQNWVVGLKLENDWRFMDYDTQGNSVRVWLIKNDKVISTTLTEKETGLYHYFILLEKYPKGGNQDNTKKLSEKQQVLESTYEKAVEELKNVVTTLMLKY